MAEVKGGAAASAAAGKGKVDKAAEKALALEKAKADKEAAAKAKELEKKKAELAKAKEKKEAELAKAKEAKSKAKEKADSEKAKAKEAKAAEMAMKKAERDAAKAEKEAAKVKEPMWVTQKDDHGNDEQIDMNKFPIPIECTYPGCGEVRYVNQSGALLVSMCKPHARKERRKRRMAKVRAKASNYKAVVKDAMEKGLFPEAFKKKHGLE